MNMLRCWIAVALLAGSWMFGLGFFYPADVRVWAAILATAAILLFGTPVPMPGRREICIAAVLLAPAALWSPWPYAVVPVLLLAGLLLELAPKSLRWLAALGDGIVTAGGILLVQGLALSAYTAQTARSHELPWPLPQFLAAVARMFSIDAAFDGVNIVFRTVRETHRLAPTWELFLDPVTFCFMIGGVVFLGIKIAGTMPVGRRWSEWLRGFRSLSVVVLAWLPLRATTLMAIFIQRVLEADPERSLYVTNHIFAPWPLLLCAAVPTLLAWHFVPRISPLPLAGTPEWSVPAVRAPADALPMSRLLGTLALSFSTVAIFTMAIYWSPVGKAKQGRVAVVERHSAWEPTERPSDKPANTAWYGEPAGYNYVAMYDFLGQYFEMSRILESGAIDDGTLEKCDVLIIKTPTERYSAKEVAAVLRFVERGGGVLFLGDHTNLDRMATTMNDMTRPMGFIFRDDLLFSSGWTSIRTKENTKPEAVAGDPYYVAAGEPTSAGERTCYHEHFSMPWPPHPVLQHMPPMEFAVSCSIDPGTSSGRSVMTGLGLWSMPPDYHMENYHPVPQHCAAMRYGAFVQLWATYFGSGRAMAFTDSTIFSSACAYQPGHAELFRDMVNWLNHANPPLSPRIWLTLLGTAILATGGWLALRQGISVNACVCIVAAGLAGWVGACVLVSMLHRAVMPVPKAERRMPRVLIDRTVSDVPLSQCFYRRGENGTGFGLLEQWIAKLGCYTIREEGKAAFSGDVLAIVRPTRTPSKEYQSDLAGYVDQGGRVLLLDSPENGVSTANEILSPLGIVVRHDEPVEGALTIKDAWPNIPVRSCVVSGGTRIAEINDKPVAATVRRGKGSVTVVGFGDMFNDRNMGYDWMIDPDEHFKRRFNVLFAVVRSVLKDKAIESTSEALGDAAGAEIAPAPTTRSHVIEKSKTRENQPELPAQELGPKD
jgi:hypothetical protein